MMRQIVKDIILCGDDAIRFANMLYRPTEDDLLHNKSIMEQIDHNITITETDNGYDAEIKDLDLDFLEEKPQYSLNNNIEITWTVNIKKESFFYSNSSNENQVQMVVDTQKMLTYEYTTSDRMSLVAA